MVHEHLFSQLLGLRIENSLPDSIKKAPTSWTFFHISSQKVLSTHILQQNDILALGIKTHRFLTKHKASVGKLNR